MKPHSRPAAARWPRTVKVGGTAEKVYRRRRSDGGEAFEVARHPTGKRKLRSVAASDKTLSEAGRIDPLLEAGNGRPVNVGRVVGATFGKEDNPSFDNQVRQARRLSGATTSKTIRPGRPASSCPLTRLRRTRPPGMACPL